MTPYKDNCFVQLETSKRETAGGILLPDTDNSEFGDGMLAGRILSAGPGGRGDDGRFYPVEVKAGDRVLLDKLAGQEVVVGNNVPLDVFPDIAPGTELRVVRAEEIIAVIE